MTYRSPINEPLRGTTINTDLVPKPEEIQNLLTLLLNEIMETRNTFSELERRLEFVSQLPEPTTDGECTKSEFSASSQLGQILIDMINKERSTREAIEYQVTRLRI